MQWTSWVNLFLAAWLILSAFASGFPSTLIMADVISGSLAAAFSIADLLKPRLWKKWAIGFIGSWLLFAPLVLWAHLPSFYANDTLVGLLFIVLSVALPSQSNVLSMPPPGWTYNPSTWPHRIPVVILALAGFFMARYMAAFQLGHIDSVWEPFFGDGTKRVLTSDVSKFFPISDAGLGATTYLLEALSGVVGDRQRWRTMPWMVFLFFVLVVPAGVVGIVLIILQPVVVGAWCTLCLMTAFTTLISIPPAVDEIFATSQFLSACHREKKSVWRIFWMGERSDSSNGFLPSPDAKLKHLNGIGLSWNLLLSTMVGIWIIFMPNLTATSMQASHSDYIVGALVTTVSVLALAEPIRTLRFMNIIFGVWICLIPVFFKNLGAASTWSHVGSGLLLIPLCLPRGLIRERYGPWTRFIV